MSRLARFTVIALLAAGASPATQPSGTSLGTLIDQLGDPDADVRQRAFDQLQARVRLHAAETLPALRDAFRHARPAVAEAAGELLLKRGWWVQGDSQAFIKAINRARYSEQPPEGRAAALQSILAERVAGGSRAVIRIAAADPADEVAWGLIEGVDLDGEAVAAAQAIDPAQRPAGLTAALARALAARGDLSALPLIREALKQDRERPAASPSQRAAAVRVLADCESRGGDPAEAAAGIRDLLAATTAPADRAALLDQLLALHAVRGPLPGIGGDLKLATAESGSHATFALAEMARRCGLPAAAASLFDTAVRSNDESDSDRAARLNEGVEFLQAAGATDLACRTLEAIAAVESPATRGRVAVAYLRLSELHESVGRYAAAGDALQRALSRQDGPLVSRNARGDAWTIEDEQAHVYYYFLLDANGRGDAAAVAKQAANILASGSTDGDLFLNALPFVQKVAKPDELDAYFNGCYDRGRNRINRMPGEPVALNDLAWLCARSGRRLEEAVTLASEAVQNAPDEAAFIDTLAEAKFRTGKATEAVELEKKAIAGSAAIDDVFMRRQLQRFQKAAATLP